ncbi:MAG: sugar ABC transporter permease [Acidimicrobiia bacterium]
MKFSRFGAKLREASLGYALLIPSLLVFGVFVFYPFIYNFSTGSYRSGIGNRPSIYVGYERWRTLLDLNVFLPSLLKGLVGGLVLGAVVFAVRRSRGADSRTALRGVIALVGFVAVLGGIVIFIRASSSTFAASLDVTGRFWIMTVPPVLILGTLMAVVSQRVVRGTGIFRTFFMLTLATGVGVAGVIFFTLLSPNVGVLPWLGISPKPQALANPTWALPSVAIFATWANAGLAFIMLSAGLQSIPDDLYEAAELDGAKPVRRFFHITMPQLSPTLLFVFVIGSITSLIQSFPYIDVTTEGRPGGRTATLPWVLVQNLNGTTPDRNAAAVYSVALFGIALILTVIQMVVLERRVHYRSEQR